MYYLFYNTGNILFKETIMEDYLHSAMSYCNVKILQDFIGTPRVTLISNNAKNAINK